ncbi:Uncharacterised protein [Mycobacterium tuberculosis]|nr:Uncharacterised protein [Mycobacterium tuberculosis]
MLDEDTEDETTNQANGYHRAVKQCGDDGRGNDPRHHQPVDGVDAQHLHRIDLFPDGAGTQVGADRCGSSARNHQHGGQRAQLGDRA